MGRLRGLEPAGAPAGGRPAGGRGGERGSGREGAAGASARGAALPQQVRIIGGMWKRTPLPVPVRPGLRPTAGRVRETVFNWLGQRLAGWRCLDAFAGSGAMGLEAASRGAEAVLLVEQDAGLVAQLRRTVAKLQAPQVRVEQGDALALLPRCAAEGWDVVFLDPPFDWDADTRRMARLLAAAREAVRARQGWVYLETPRPWTADQLRVLGLEAARQGRAGAAHHALLRVREGSVERAEPHDAGG